MGQTILIKNAGAIVTCDVVYVNKKVMQKGTKKLCSVSTVNFFERGTACKNAKVLALRNEKGAVSRGRHEQDRGEVLNFWCSF